MNGNIYRSLVVISITILILTSGTHASGFWQAPFDNTGTKTKVGDSVLSLDDVLDYVASENRMFQSYQYLIESEKNNLSQVGLRPNPELEIEIEEFDWNSPGFKESEITLTLSQEFELFGQRKTRKKYAQALVNDTELEVKQLIFDLYLTTKYRYYNLVQAQQQVKLSELAVELSEEIVENINFRMNKGAALQSEILLAQIEQQRTMLDLEKAHQEVKAFENSLVSLWNGDPRGIKIQTGIEPNFPKLFKDISHLKLMVDSTREVNQLNRRSKLLLAENEMVKADAKPAVTISGGIKRFEIDNSKSFVLGFSMPLPFSNRNQGTQKSIGSRIKSLDYKIAQTKNEVVSIIDSYLIKLSQLKDRHESLDTLLIPTAKNAYQKLKEAYEAGRIPYTHLLEAERTLNELNFEHNDMLFTIHKTVIELERLSGFVIRVESEN